MSETRTGPDAGNAPPDDTGTTALRALQSLADKLSSCQGKDEAFDLWSAYLATEPFDGLAHACLEQPGAYGSALTECKRARIATEVTALDREVRRRVKRIEDEARRSEHQERAEGPRPLPPLGVDLPELIVPPGWHVDNGGVWREPEPGSQIRVTYAPLLVTGALHSVDDGSQRMWVEWRDGDGHWSSRIVPRAAVRDVRSVVALANGGADVGTHNNKHVVQWLADLEGVNQSRLPRAMVSDRLGWQGPNGEFGFLLGRQLHGSDDPVPPDAPPARWKRRTVVLDVDGGLAQVADGFTRAGSEAGWVEALEDVWGYPAVVLALYASLAAPYLGIIPQAPNMILDWSGETSHGKTTTLRVGASVWGNPDERGGGIIHHWKATPSSIERTAGLCQHVPLFLDDTKQAHAPEFVRDMIYMLAGGRGKARATPDGLRTTASWRMPLLSTGESSITSFSQDAGARARCLCLTELPFKDGDRGDQVWRLTEAVMANHGHAGPRLVATLAKHRDQWGAVRIAYEEARDQWARKAKGGPAARVAATMALLEMGARAAHRTLGLRTPDDGVRGVLDYAWEAALRGVSDTDRPLAALEATWRWAVAHSAEFWGRHERPRQGAPRQPVKGWAGTWEDHPKWDVLAFSPEALDRVLRFHGFEPSAILNSWHERGWLMTGTEKDRPGYVRMSIGDNRPRARGLRRDAMKSLGICD